MLLLVVITQVGSREKGLENFLLEKLTNGNVGLFDLMHDTEKIADRCVHS